MYVHAVLDTFILVLCLLLFISVFRFTVGFDAVVPHKKRDPDIACPISLLRLLEILHPLGLDLKGLWFRG